ncbi:MAG: bifunctional sulfate adenylyltransferase/adenylylsulfate kinase [Planctomycetota bacterium]
MSTKLNAPHGGTLIQLLADADRAAELKQQSRDWPSWDLTPRQACDVELLLNGAFSPLQGFLSRGDYESVCDKMRLGDGTLWPIPVTLDVSEEVAEKLERGKTLALRDQEGVMLAVLHVDEVWRPDLTAEAERVYGTKDEAHPAVHYLLKQSQPCYVGGRLEGAQMPIHYDFKELRLSPAELRRDFEKNGWTKIVAFQTRNPMHRAHFELTLRASKNTEASLLIHPVVGMTKPGDVDHFTRVRCYEALLPRYPQLTVKLSLLPMAMRMGGPREALWHAIIRKNYGCTHLIVGRDHAGPGNDSKGDAFYGPYDAQEMLREHEKELGMTMVPFQQMVYVEEQDAYFAHDEAPDDARVLSISGTELRKRLSEGKPIPEWFTYPEVAKVLQQSNRPRHKQGFTVFMTGLSGSGKSTIANALLVKCCEMGGRPVTLLDGDIVRKHLSSELGFSKEHRNINIRRIGYVASEITKNGGIAICAPIAPYDEMRRAVREMVEEGGGFILVYIKTPIEVCEERDRKGLYAKARAGIIKEFTGISDPYEEPPDADVVIETTEASPGQAAQQIILHLEHEGYVG